MANSMLHVNLRPRRGVREAQLHDLHKGGESLVGGSAGAGSMEQKQWLEVWARGSVAAAIGV